jgi:hypothetical protein
MTAPTPPSQAGGGTGGDTTDDDQQWFDLLAGRPSAGADAATRAEAARLRQALLQHRPAAPAGDPAAPDVRIARLLGRARAEGVLAAPLAAAPRPSWPLYRRRQAWAGALAAGVAALGITLLLRSPDNQTAPEAVLRGASVQQLQVADPEQRRQQLLQALRAAGLDAHPFDRLGRPGLDIALPVPLPPAQARALADLGIAAPAGPSLQIELLPAVPLVPGALPSASQTR